jgi:SAM-dependent methyltransferase
MSGHEYSGKSAYRGVIASRYDEDRTVEAIWAVEQDFVGKWVEGLPKGGEILDIPAGTGRFLEFFQKQGLTVHALDVSPDMVAEIHRRYPELAKGAHIAVGDAEHLALPDDAVEFVLSWRFFHLIPTAVADRVLREFHRVCRGTVVVQVFGVRPPFWRRVINGLRRRLSPTSPAPAPASPESGGTAASPWAHIASFAHTESGLRAQFKRAGFVLDHAVTIDVQFGLPNRVYFLRRSGAAART